MNKVQLIGRLTKDPEVKLTPNQTKFCMFTVAVERRFKDANGQRQTDFINCVAWKNTAEFLSKYFKKGSRLAVSGTIQTRNYETQEGEKKFITEVLAEDVEFIDSPSTKQETAEAAQPDASEMPFEI